MARKWKYKQYEFKIKKKAERTASENMTAFGIKAAIFAVLLLTVVTFIRPKMNQYKQKAKSTVTQMVPGNVSALTEGTPIDFGATTEDPIEDATSLFSKLEKWLTTDVF